jgi:hypothetical protein
MSRSASAGLAIALALGIGAIGVAGIWVLGPPEEDDCLYERGLREGASTGVGPDLWPPLTRECEFTRRGETTTSSYLPRLEYVIWLSLAVLVGLCVWFALNPSWRTAAWTAAVVVALAALTVANFQY